MPATEKRTVSLPREQATYMDRLVNAGAYASASEVVRAGLRALQERDAAVERWLREEVVPVAVSMRDDPARGMTAENVFGEIRQLHSERSKGSG
jgi:antitoxin ParD1/3/4